VARRQRFPTGEQLPQSAQQRGVFVDDRVEQGGCEPCGGHAVRSDHAGEAAPGGNLFQVENATAAVEQRAPHFQR